MKRLIKGGNIVYKDRCEKQDILIDGEKIARVAESIDCPDAEVIDAAGMDIFPGFIDAHTHMDIDTPAGRSPDDFDRGTKAAVCGGTTTIIDFGTQNRGETLEQALKNWHEMASVGCWCDYGFHMSITDWNEKTHEEMSLMTREGITSYKVYMAYDALRVTDGEIFEILKAVEEQGGILCTHCENGDLIKELTKQELARGNRGPAAHPIAHAPAIEAEAIERYITIGDMARCPVYIVHTSTMTGLRTAIQRRATGSNVYIESCPQYFIKDVSEYDAPFEDSCKVVMSPPLRRAEDRRALWSAAASGEIDVISTDHCPFTVEQKAVGRGDFSKIPNGGPGVQERPMLMYSEGVATGRITKGRMMEMLCENPAKLFGMYPKKGAIAEGSDADIVIWDGRKTGAFMNADAVSACGYTNYNGMELTGRPHMVLLRGETASVDGAVTGEKRGEYVKRGPSQWTR